MLKYKFIKYGDAYSLLIGTIHNCSKSKEFISFFLSQTQHKFDFYVLELNKNNFLFIKENKIKISEFFEFTNENISKDKLVLIDMSLENQVKTYSGIKIKNKISKDIFVDFLSFKLEKFLYYKIKNIDYRLSFNQFPSVKYFHHSHIDCREDFMKQELKKLNNKNNLIVVGINHFETIKNFMSEF